MPIIRKDRRAEVYGNLRELLRQSSSSRKLYFSQSVEMQLKLSSYSEYIHSLEQLSLAIEAINDYDSAVKISESLF